MPRTETPPWAVVDGAYAKREFLRPAKQSGFVVVARLRKDAALFDLPPVLPPGTKRGRGRPPIDGKNSLSLAKRAGQTRGWAEVTTRTTTGRPVNERYKTFLATWAPTGGAIRVVILKAKDDSWRAFPCTDPEADVKAIVQPVHDRWAIEQNYHDLKEVERIEQVGSRRVRSNVGALNLSLWVHSLIGVWDWKQDASTPKDRRIARGMIRGVAPRMPTAEERCGGRCGARNISVWAFLSRCVRESRPSSTASSGSRDSKPQFWQSADTH